MIIIILIIFIVRSIIETDFIITIIIVMNQSCSPRDGVSIPLLGERIACANSPLPLPHHQISDGKKKRNAYYVCFFLSFIQFVFLVTSHLISLNHVNYITLSILRYQISVVLKK